MKNIFILTLVVILASCSTSGVTEETVANDTTTVAVDTTLDTTVVVPAEIDTTIK